MIIDNEACCNGMQSKKKLLTEKKLKDEKEEILIHYSRYDSCYR